MQQLRDENTRLKELLTAHGIPWGDISIQVSQNQHIKKEDLKVRFSLSEKVSLFQNLFRGRTDVYPVRWESTRGKSGYSPACANEWKRDVCKKPRIKCSECDNRVLLPVTDQVIYDHLAGNHTIGVYPLLADDTCCFLAVDFDDGDWRKDAQSFLQSCLELNIPAALEVSRSGNGAHVWIFFSGPVSAREARQLGVALISYTCNRKRQLSLASYDRLFPNQDTLPKGGFGNLIALPLQKYSREQGFSIFVDENHVPYSNQWAFLASIIPMPRFELENVILKAADGVHPLDVTFVSEENEYEPWQRSTPISSLISDPLPESLKLVLANQIFIAKADLPQALMNRLIRLAAFQNPEFYKAQAMRLSVWNKARIIGCAENFPEYIGLPIGCLDAVQELLKQNNIKTEIQDERVQGYPIEVKFVGKLRKDQQKAVKTILMHEMGVLCAPPGFGKTVSAAALIAQRSVSTLILLHRTELLRQWQERLLSFMEWPKETLGLLGGGHRKLTGKIDIVIMQSLSRREDLLELLEGYGQIIVDECHHVSAFSFESILKKAKVKFILGLTATPVRRDGHHPIIFMQCGPIRYRAPRGNNISGTLEVCPQYLPAPYIPQNSEIQDVFRILIHDTSRNRRIIQDILDAYEDGRKILVLTERIEHLEILNRAIITHVENCFVLHGRLSKKQRTEILAKLEALEDFEPRILIATGKLIGEGFDYPVLDTLFLVMPISWKGTLQQYVGRLHREHVEKQSVQIYDYIERDHVQLFRMWNKRQRGYTGMGYQIRSFL